MRWSAGGRVALGILAVAAVTGCTSNPRPRPVAVQPIVRDTPAALRRTLGATATFNGTEPVLVSGYGLVVGLRGTGGGILDETIAAHIERQMALRGVSIASEGQDALAGRSPRDVLRDPNVAVAEVQAAIPPGSPEGKTFDVYVRALNATSLEGGTLMPEDLRIGPPSTFTQAQSFKIAEARGPVFINPFAEPGREDDGITRTSGRVLSGGVVSDPLAIEMALDFPSHSAARQIVQTINTRFPRGPQDRLSTASGRTGGNPGTGAGGTITLRVPAAYRENPAEFLDIIKHLERDLRYPEQMSKGYADAIKAQPMLAEELAWCLVAVGEKSLPFAREMYDSGERASRVAALKVGAVLSDPRVADPLAEVARNGTGRERIEAIKLLARVDAGPKVDMALRALLREPELAVRIAAYEGLARRAERAQLARLVDREYAKATGPWDVRPISHLEALSRLQFEPGVQGVRRVLVEDKFFLDLVPDGEPMIYVTQQGVPRIVVFGPESSLKRPVLVSAWSDRLILVGEKEGEPIRLAYRDYGTNQTVNQNISGSLTELILFMARVPTPQDPRPGLALTYAEVVGAVAEIYKARATSLVFATEQDKLNAEIAEARHDLDIRERPITTKDKEEIIVLRMPGEPAKPAPGSDPSKPPPVLPIPGAAPAETAPPEKAEKGS